MNALKQITLISLSSLFLMTASGCTPEVGSKAWCEQIADKPLGERSLNEGVDYAKHCVFQNDDE